MLSVIRNVRKCLSLVSELASRNATHFMLEMLSHLIGFFLFCLFQGGLAPGGFNFDAKLSVLLYLYILVFLFVLFPPSVSVLSNVIGGERAQMLKTCS